MFWRLIAPWPAGILALAVTGYVLVARRASTVRVQSGRSSCANRVISVGLSDSPMRPR